MSPAASGAITAAGLIIGRPAATISPMTFSRARLRGHRNGRSLTQAGLAGAAGLDPAVLAGIEDGAVEPQEHVVAALAVALGIPRAALVPERGDWTEDYIATVAGYRPPLVSTRGIRR